MGRYLNILTRTEAISIENEYDPIADDRYLFFKANFHRPCPTMPGSKRHQRGRRL
jgi:hypothetical protein